MNIKEVLSELDLQAAFKESLRKFIEGETSRLKTDYYFERAKVSAKGETIRNIVLEKELFGCQRGNVLEVLSIYTGEDLRDAADQIDWSERFPMIVFLDDRNGHNYDLNQPVLSLGNGRGVGLGGNMGNNLDTRRRTIRPATPDEIEKYFLHGNLLGMLACLMRYWYTH